MLTRIGKYGAFIGVDLNISHTKDELTESSKILLEQLLDKQVLLLDTTINGNKISHFKNAPLDIEKLTDPHQALNLFQSFPNTQKEIILKNCKRALIHPHHENIKIFYLACLRLVSLRKYLIAEHQLNMTLPLLKERAIPGDLAKKIPNFMERRHEAVPEKTLPHYLLVLNDFRKIAAIYRQTEQLWFQLNRQKHDATFFIEALKSSLNLIKQMAIILGTILLFLKMIQNTSRNYYLDSFCLGALFIAFLHYLEKSLNHIVNPFDPSEETLFLTRHQTVVNAINTEVILALNALSEKNEALKDLAMRLQSHTALLAKEKYQSTHLSDVTQELEEVKTEILIKNQPLLFFGKQLLQQAAKTEEKNQKGLCK